jgi:hypothetical protein
VRQARRPFPGRARTRRTAPVLLPTCLPACHSWRTGSLTPQSLVGAKHRDQVRVVRSDGTKQVLHQPAVAADALRGTARDLAAEVARPA